MGLIWLVVAGVVLWTLVRLGRQTERAKRGHWRIAATLMAAALMGGGALVLARGAWLAGGAMIAAGLYLVLSSRERAVPRRAEPLSLAEARALLGVPADADAAEIQAAWRRLMARAHPDQGGTEGLAARLNQARDRLLRRP